MRISDWSSDVCSSDLGNLADMRAAFHELVRLLRFVHGKHAMYDGSAAPLLHERDNVFDQSLGDLPFVFVAAWAQGGAGEGQALGHDRCGIDAVFAAL